LWRIGATAVLPEPALGLYGLRDARAALTQKAGQAVLAIEGDPRHRKLGKMPPRPRACAKSFR
jgi:hypothetical protein